MNRKLNEQRYADDADAAWGDDDEASFDDDAGVDFDDDADVDFDFDEAVFDDLTSSDWSRAAVDACAVEGAFDAR
jgi:hypothetical protein